MPQCWYVRSADVPSVRLSFGHDRPLALQHHPDRQPAHRMGAKGRWRHSPLELELDPAGAYVDAILVGADEADADNIRIEARPWPTYEERMAIFSPAAPWKSSRDPFTSSRHPIIWPNGPLARCAVLGAPLLTGSALGRSVFYTLRLRSVMIAIPPWQLKRIGKIGNSNTGAGVAGHLPMTPQAGGCVTASRKLGQERPATWQTNLPAVSVAAQIQPVTRGMRVVGHLRRVNGEESDMSSPCSWSAVSASSV